MVSTSGVTALISLPDDPELLKQMLAKMQFRVGFLEEQVAPLRQRLFGRQSERTVDPATPQLALFNEAEHGADPLDEAA
jgi:transposase